MWRAACWALGSVLLAFVGLAGPGAAQTGTGGEQATAPMQSTKTGVFSAPQAARGEETYMGVCVACHPAGTYKTAIFRETWNGRALSELFDQVREKMPKNAPATLTPEDYAQVVAYLLKINGVPAGETELPADTDALKKIRIEMPSDADRQH
jgi:mono/diheme cytochrome c family protein